METTVGCHSFPLPDPHQGVVLPAWHLYPTSAPATPTHFGPYTLDVAMDAPREGEHPLVVISHGNGGSPWTHRDLAVALVQGGYEVAFVEHLGNSRSDDSLANTAANLANRPRHVRLLLEALDATSVSLVGHSIGAYTALAVAGGEPVAYPDPTPIPVVPFPGVRALVLLAPAAIWFAPPGSLARVKAPIFMRTGQRDTVTPAVHAEGIMRDVSVPVNFAAVPNAGHFSFQSPFPPEMTRPDFPPSQDPPGFDRSAYQALLARQVLAFLRTHAY